MSTTSSWLLSRSNQGMPGVVLVTEDLWAKSLSTAAQRAGGQIVAGERIPASRVEAALGDRRLGNG